MRNTQGNNVRRDQQPNPMRSPPGYDICPVCCAKNIYSGHADFSGRLSEIDGRRQGTTGRSRPLPFTGPGIIVDDEENINHGHHSIAEGLASQAGAKKLKWLV